jgi:hypothetical protein
MKFIAPNTAKIHADSVKNFTCTGNPSQKCKFERDEKDGRC